ncbi:Esterase B1, partial [Pseudolycoriella hygida]
MKTDTIIVETSYGPVRGIKRTSAVGDQFFSFRGIPYAKPPIGELRFKDPQLPDSWTHPIDATEAGHAAPALNMFTKGVVGNENCLILNVYTREYGDGSEMIYGPDYLLSKDIVYVSMNYRLGVLGFLSIEDPSAQVPGNAGIKDQSMALQWVRKNIHAFGGNSKNITVFGESAGAGSVHLHMLSDLSKGLFDKAIVQSGSALASWCNNPNKNWAERVAKKLGWDGVGGATELVNFLRKVDVEKLILAQEFRTDEEKRDWVFSEWGPCVEPYVSEQCLLDRSPSDMLKTAWSNGIPLIIGGTTEEGLLMYRDVTADPELYKGEKAYENLIPKEWNLSEEKTKTLAENLKSVYIEGGCPTKNEMQKFLDIISDKLFWHGMHSAVLGRLQVNAAPTYLYRFAFSADAKSNHIRQFLVPSEVKGVCHGEDIASIFKFSMNKEPTINGAEHRAIDRMTSLFTRFATTGNPNCDITKHCEWKSIPNRSSPPFKCLNIDDELSFIFYPESRRIALWDSMRP